MIIRRKTESYMKFGLNLFWNSVSVCLYLYQYRQKRVDGEFISAKSMGPFCNVAFLPYFPCCPVTRLLLIL